MTTSGARSLDETQTAKAKAVIASNLSFGFGGFELFVLKGSPAHVSPLSQPRHTAWYPASYPGQPPGAATTTPWFPAAFRPPAFASWASCSRQGFGLPLRSAYRHLPGEARWLCRTLTGFPCSARVRHSWGWVPSLPRGRRCRRGRRSSATAACRISTAKSLSVQRYRPSRTV